MPLTKKPEPTKPILWGVFKTPKKTVWLGEVEALYAAAVEKGLNSRYRLTG